MDSKVHKYFQGRLDEKERLLLLKEADSNPSLKSRFVEIKNIYALSSLSDDANDMEENYTSYQHFIKDRRKKQLYDTVLRIAGYAAAVVFVVISTYMVTLRTVRPVNHSFAMHRLSVPAGQRLKFSLQDGTEVWLNACTTLSYPVLFDEGERRVIVDGEALFDVAEDKNRPFIVSSKGVEIKALGTRFNINSYPETNYMCVGLLSGKLNVYRRNEEAEGVILNPNQQVLIEDGYFTVTPVYDPDYFLWTEGIYSFKDEPLINIIRKLELYFDIKIVVEDPFIYTWEYTGKFRQRDGVDGILRIIQKIHPFKIEKDEENNMIRLR
jgi:ferric-dicitrate binding protein FerR (iron transport regulator)